MAPHFVATPWRDANELLDLRRDLYDARPQVAGPRQQAVTKVLAWRLRRAELPLLLESTADMVEATLRDDQGELSSSTLKLLYATAISRYVVS